MKKAFTLIELLVVIAIIAILAAILFPVFAQAKLAAKKTQSISSQKQIGLGLLMYTGDYDDTYPRNDDCQLNSALNSKFNTLAAGSDPSSYCNGSANPGGYAFRVNHYGWQKWVLPYIKSVNLFIDPVQKEDAYSWNTLGELNGGYQLNLALTGALNSWNRALTSSFTFRDPFLGGTTTAVPSPADAFILMSGPYNPVVPAYSSGNASDTSHTTYYPLAIREHWYGYFYKSGGTGPCSTTTTIDPTVVPYGNQVPLSYTDGHTKTIAVGDFLGKTPTAATYGAASTACTGYATPNGGVVSSVNPANGWAPSSTVGSWPMWGLN